MEPVFEIHSVIDRRMMAEYLRKHVRKVYYWICGAFAIAFLVLGMGLESVLMYGIVAMTAAYFTPDLIAWTSLKPIKEQNNSCMPENIVTVGDHIHVHQDVNDTTLPFDRLTKVEHLRHSYVLYSGKAIAVLLDPDGFTKGTFAEFKQFLREKRPDLTIPE